VPFNYPRPAFRCLDMAMTPKHHSTRVSAPISVVCCPSSKPCVQALTPSRLCFRFTRRQSSRRHRFHDGQYRCNVGPQLCLCKSRWKPKVHILVNTRQAQVTEHCDLQLLRNNLESSAALASHPMLLMLLQLELESDRVKEKCNYEEHFAVSAIREQTGFNSPWSKNKQWNAKMEMSSDVPRDNFLNLIHRLGDFNGQASRNSLYIRYVDRLSNFILSNVDDLSKTWQKHGKHDLQRTESELKNRVRLIRAAIEVTTAQHEENRKEIEFQQSTIYNLIAQQDSNTNLEIAKDSRRDSASMKTIAIMTTLFLPATWVATFFAVPLFDWTVDEGQSVIRSRFWMYWALTGVLTLVVVCVWLGWTWFLRKKDKFAPEHNQSLLPKHKKTGSPKGSKRPIGKQMEMTPGRVETIHEFV
jgi:hypothetical protein